ncbi:hypothetical protein WJX84_004435 [Apatococcus fuscideae]|uniref:Glycosyltransferase family 92 protein n=1 Tax=Apatococcus fuscideae TaxID=2026836 RepID=A0AAW1SQ18_9CHLO
MSFEDVAVVTCMCPRGLVSKAGHSRPDRGACSTLERDIFLPILFVLELSLQSRCPPSAASEQPSPGTLTATLWIIHQQISSGIHPQQPPWRDGISCAHPKTFSQIWDAEARCSQESGLPSTRTSHALKNEVPYVVEWIEFHRLQGFSHLVIYDDFSSDNISLLETLYREHGRDYVSVERGAGEGDSNALRRGLDAQHCTDKYSHLADWMINLDIDEFVWSPKYANLQDYFRNEVLATNHIHYMGATRFGWSGMRHRFTYSLQEVTEAGTGHTVELLNPNGVQLLATSHIHRAPDSRLGEPEQVLKDSNADCVKWATEIGEWSPCTNDYDNKFGKTFMRMSHAKSVWTHGGSLGGDFPDIILRNGADLHTADCPSPICEQADSRLLHIYHFRAPSLADLVKKDVEEFGISQEDADKRFLTTDAAYEDSTWIFNQIRDVALVAFGEPLQQRIAPLLTHHQLQSAATR